MAPSPLPEWIVLLSFDPKIVAENGHSQCHINQIVREAKCPLHWLAAVTTRSLYHDTTVILFLTRLLMEQGPCGSSTLGIAAFPPNYAFVLHACI